MVDEVFHRRGTTLVRRMRLAPGECTAWHRDPFHRVSVVLAGDVLEIEFRDGGPPHRVEPKPVQVDWDEPGDRIHRAVNSGRQNYEEITIFFLDRPGAIPQPVEN